MKDAVNREIQIGDYVGFALPIGGTVLIGHATGFDRKDVDVNELETRTDYNGTVFVSESRDRAAYYIRADELIVINEIATNWKYVSRSEFENVSEIF